MWVQQLNTLRHPWIIGVKDTFGGFSSQIQPLTFRSPLLVLVAWLLFILSHLVCWPIRGWVPFTSLYLIWLRVFMFIRVALGKPATAHNSRLIGVMNCRPPVVRTRLCLLCCWHAIRTRNLKCINQSVSRWYSHRNSLVTVSSLDHD